MAKINTISENTIAQLASYFLQHIKILNQPTSSRHRVSHPVEALKVGDIVIDRELALENGSCAGALCRVALLSPGGRVALLLNLKPECKTNKDYLKYDKGIKCLTTHK